MLTDQQKITLKAAIEQNPVWAAIPNDDDHNWDIAHALNEPAAEFIVWRSDVAPEEVMRNGMDWTRVDNLSVGKARIWEWISRLGIIDASKPNIRAGIEACWVGTAADLAVRAMVYVHCKRPALLIEKILASGTGTTESPATMSYEGTITFYDVTAARSFVQV